MSDPITIGGEPVAAGVTWFLETFLTPAVDAAKARRRQKKTEFDWGAAAEAYRASLIKHYGQIRIFGTSQEAPLQEIFTDVYIFEEPMARIPYELEALRQSLAEERHFRFRQRATAPVNGMALAKQGRNLFVLGKPGAGKTTFLKYLALQAAKNNLNRIPIFVSLNAWANSAFGRGADPQLLPFIVREFAICGFADAEEFVVRLLNSGKALLLFDGLDEVKQEREQRRQLVQLLTDFARQYDRSQHLITCRIAASDYLFPGFQDVEVADFSEEQVQRYAQLWFATKAKQHDPFLEELAKPENSGVRELCNSPLLLSMICLYFNHRMRFPPNRGELYEDAVEALLNEWDASRAIQRDEMPGGEAIYRELSPRRKEQLFAEIAARTFETGDYIFRRRDLVKWIGAFLTTLPNIKASDLIDPDVVLHAIEAQHGIFVERAKDIYSFSHLTFQEYFTARYIFDHERRGATVSLLKYHLTDNRWREIFLLTVSLFDREGADDFFRDMRRAIDHLLVGDATLTAFVQWAEARTGVVEPVERRATVRLAYIVLGLAHIRSRNLDLVLPFAQPKSQELSRSVDRAFALAPSLSLDRVLVRALDRALDLALDGALDRANVIDSAKVGALVRTLAKEISVDWGFDYGIYYTWAAATIFAEERFDRRKQVVGDTLDDYTKLVVGIAELAQAAGRTELANPLVALTVPRPHANTQAWKEFADRLFALLQQRDLAHDWAFTEEQIAKLNAWLGANELLVQCLNVAVVPDREAILAGLLAPPAG